MMEKPLCAVRGVIRPGAMCSRVIVGMERCGFAGSCEHQRPVPTAPMGIPGQPVHTSGYLQTASRNVVPPVVPAGGLDLNDDTPLPGGTCDPSRPEGCESCQ